jgi:hypothetical protein
MIAVDLGENGEKFGQCEIKMGTTAFTIPCQFVSTFHNY